MGYRLIKVPECPNCGKACKDTGYCYKCMCRCKLVKRDRLRVSDKFKVVDWFSSRSSAGLVVEDTAGNRYEMYMSDVFEFLTGTELGSIVIEETKKGSAYGWKVISKEAVN